MMRVLGTGQVSVAGRGIAALARYLAGGRPADAGLLEIRSAAGVEHAPCLALGEEDTADRGALPARKTRRLDPFARMLVLAAAEAVAGARREQDVPRERTGVITVSRHGPVRTSFAVLDDVFAGGDEMVSPVRFAVSVGNAAAAAIAQVLGFHGPLLALAGAQGLLLEALAAARSWLERGTVEAVLVAGGDEVHEVLVHGMVAHGEVALDGKPRPLGADGGRVVPAPGAGALLLGADRPARAGAPLLAVREEVSPGEEPFPGDWPVVLAAGGWREEGDFFRRAAERLGDRAVVPARHLGSIAAGEVLATVVATCLLAEPGEAVGQRSASPGGVARVDCLCGGPRGDGYLVQVSRQ